MPAGRYQDHPAAGAQAREKFAFIPVPNPFSGGFRISVFVTAHRIVDDSAIGTKAHDRTTNTGGEVMTPAPCSCQSSAKSVTSASLNLFRAPLGRPAGLPLRPFGNCPVGVRSGSAGLSEAVGSRETSSLRPGRSSLAWRGSAKPFLTDSQIDELRSA